MTASPLGGRVRCQGPAPSGPYDYELIERARRWIEFMAVFPRLVLPVELERNSALPPVLRLELWGVLAFVMAASSLLVAVGGKRVGEFVSC